MKIFVSWSGVPSGDVARALKEWLPDVVQPLDTSDIFLSSEDIPAGSEWFSVVGSVLDECDFGIVCLTPENVSRPWLLYEAGALSKRFGKSLLVPLLIGLKNDELSGPMAHFNTVSVGFDGIRHLVETVNAQLGTGAVGTSKLEHTLQAFWPRLEPVLLDAEAMASHSGGFTYDVFLSAPMAAFDDDEQFTAARADFHRVYQALRDSGLSVFWASAGIESMAEYESMDVSAEEDLTALRQSRYFVLLYPERLVTSALFEAGFAAARRMPSLYVVRARADLPYLMRELAGPVPQVRVLERDVWKDVDHLADLVRKQHDVWFPR